MQSSGDTQRLLKRICAVLCLCKSTDLTKNIENKNHLKFEFSHRTSCSFTNTIKKSAGNMKNQYLFNLFVYVCVYVFTYNKFQLHENLNRANH